VLTDASNSLARFAEPLGYIPALDRDTWLSVGMALHYESAGSDAGFAMWCEWSRTCLHGVRNGFVEAEIGAWIASRVAAHNTGPA
jgi:Primase C terminal 2 (PriCT-2)